MSLLSPQAGDIPLPDPGPISAPYWQGCREGVLRYQQCLDCGAPTHTPALMCAACTSMNLEWVDSSGLGEIYSWTRVWRPVTPAFITPYVPILSNLVGCEDDSVAIGQLVEVEFHHSGGPDDIWLPYFHHRSS